MATDLFQLRERDRIDTFVFKEKEMCSSVRTHTLQLKRNQIENRVDPGERMLRMLE